MGRGIRITISVVLIALVMAVGIVNIRGLGENRVSAEDEQAEDFVQIEQNLNVELQDPEEELEPMQDRVTNETSANEKADQLENILGELGDEIGE